MVFMFRFPFLFTGSTNRCLTFFHFAPVATEPIGPVGFEVMASWDSLFQARVVKRGQTGRLC